MSGNKMLPRYVDFRDIVVEEFENFNIIRCQYRDSEEDQAYQDGYSIVFKRDDVIQARSPSFTSAVQAVFQAEQVLQFLAAHREQEASQAGTEGLLSDSAATDMDVIN